MPPEIVTRALPTRRLAWVVGVLTALAGGVAAWFAYQGLKADAAAEGTSHAARSGTVVVMGVGVVIVMGVLLFREISDAVLTYTDETLRYHAGGGKVIRWQRIAAVEPGRFGRCVVLVLHGNGRAELLPGTRWLTQVQRDDLCAELDEYRARARRLPPRD